MKHMLNSEVTAVNELFDHREIMVDCGTNPGVNRIGCLRPSIRGLTSSTTILKHIAFVGIIHKIPSIAVRLSHLNSPTYL